MKRTKTTKRRVFKDTQKKQRKPPSKLIFLDLPPSLTGSSKDENIALSKKHYEAKKCKNCGNFNPKFGDHLNHKCHGLYQMRAGFDWPDSLKTTSLSKRRLAQTSSLCVRFLDSVHCKFMEIMAR